MQTQGLLTEIRDGNVVIVVFGTPLQQIEEVNVTEVGQKLVEITDRLTQPLLVLDMTATEFFGSSFIEVLFRVWKQLSLNPAAQLAIVGLQPYCREVLKVTHLDTLWQIFDTQEEASKALNQGLATR